MMRLHYTKGNVRRVIFVALTNILLLTALVSLVSNSLTEVSNSSRVGVKVMVGLSWPHEHGRDSAFKAPI